MCRFIDNFMDIQSNAVTTDESIVLKLAEDIYFLVNKRKISEPNIELCPTLIT